MHGCQFKAIQRDFIWMTSSSNVTRGNQLFMENRWFQRAPAEVNVMIQYAPLGLVSAVSKNISCLGMYVQTNSIILSCEENVDISFRYPDNENGQHFTLEAEIIHSGIHGAGLHFVDFQLGLPSGRSAEHYPSPED